MSLYGSFIIYNRLASPQHCAAVLQLRAPQFGHNQLPRLQPFTPHRSTPCASNPKHWKGIWMGGGDSRQWRRAAETGHAAAAHTGPFPPSVTANARPHKAREIPACAFGTESRGRSACWVESELGFGACFHATVGFQECSAFAKSGATGWSDNES